MKLQGNINNEEFELRQGKHESIGTIGTKEIQ